MRKGIHPQRPLCFGSLEVDTNKVWSNAPLHICHYLCSHRPACRFAHMKLKPGPVTLRDAFIKVLLKENNELFNSLWTKCIQCDKLVEEALELKATLEETRGNMEALGFV